jgi:hypothetical protein
VVSIVPMSGEHLALPHNPLSVSSCTSHHTTRHTSMARTEREN